MIVRVEGLDFPMPFAGVAGLTPFARLGAAMLGENVVFLGGAAEQAPGAGIAGGKKKKPFGSGGFP
jgi:hypothetical protein